MKAPTSQIFEISDDLTCRLDHKNDMVTLTTSAHMLGESAHSILMSFANFIELGAIAANLARPPIGTTSAGIYRDPPPAPKAPPPPEGVDIFPDMDSIDTATLGMLIVFDQSPDGRRFYVGHSAHGAATRCDKPVTAARLFDNAETAAAIARALGASVGKFTDHAFYRIMLRSPTGKLQFWSGENSEPVDHVDKAGMVQCRSNAYIMMTRYREEPGTIKYLLPLTS
jgi:hypothetical protein